MKDVRILIKNDKGQSLIEFLLMLPVLFAITLVLVKVNTAIQMSIVNQKYARAQALFLTYNNSTYPRLGQRGTSQAAGREFEMLVLGVSGNLGDGEESFNPEANTQLITRPGQPIGSDEPQELQPNRRGKIRVRTTVALCTQDNKLILDEGDARQFNFCRSPI